MDVTAAAKAYNQKALREDWNQFCDPTLAFSDRFHASLLSVWEAKLGGRAMPSRSEMTPRDLKDALRNLVLLQREQQNPSRYRWRIIGTGITDILGHQTGKRLEDHIPPEHLHRWVDSYDMILTSEQPWRFFGRVRITSREYLDAEHLYVPLADDTGIPAFVMGLCHYRPHHLIGESQWQSQVASLSGALL